MAVTLSHLMSQTPIDPPILQVLGIKKLTHPSTTDRYRIVLSDGLNSINFAVLATQHNPKIENREISCNCVIRLNRHITSVFNDDGVKRHVLILLDIDVLVPGDEMSKIGNPIMYKDNPTPPPPSTGHAASVAPTPTNCNTQPSKTNQFTPIAQLATASLEEMVPIVALGQARVNDFEGAKSISTDILSTILTAEVSLPCKIRNQKDSLNLMMKLSSLSLGQLFCSFKTCSEEHFKVITVEGVLLNRFIGEPKEDELNHWFNTLTAEYNVFGQNLVEVAILVFNKEDHTLVEMYTIECIQGFFCHFPTDISMKNIGSMFRALAEVITETTCLLNPKDLELTFQVIPQANRQAQLSALRIPPSDDLFELSLGSITTPFHQFQLSVEVPKIYKKMRLAGIENYLKLQIGVTANKITWSPPPKGLIFHYFISGQPEKDGDSWENLLEIMAGLTVEDNSHHGEKQGQEQVVMQGGEEVVAATNNLAVATNLAIAVESPSTKMVRPSVAISPRANNSPARSPSPFINATPKTPNGHKKVFTRVGRESKKTVRYIELIDASKK